MAAESAVPCPMTAHGPLSALFHDAASPEASAAEVAWYAERMPRGAGPVLDAMCGTGRILVPLAARGWNVHGADASPAAIERCEAKLAAAGCRATLFRQAATSLNLPFRYGAAFVAGGAFCGLADAPAARAALARLRAHLVLPGVLLLDLVVPEWALRRPGAPLVHVRSAKVAEGVRITCRAEVDVDPDARRIGVRSRYERRQNGAIVAREDESSALTWYDEEAIAALLIDAGFRDVAVERPARAPAAAATETERRFAVSARA